MPFSPVFAPALSKPRRSAISDRRGFRIHDRGVRISLRTNTIRSPKPSPTGKVARASPASARRMRDKASLVAEQGERQSPPFYTRGGWHGFAVTGGIVRSSKVFLNCHDLTIPQSKIKDFCQLPLHKGALGAPAPVRLSRIPIVVGRCGHRPLQVLNRLSDILKLRTGGSVHRCAITFLYFLLFHPSRFTYTLPLSNTKL